MKNKCAFFIFIENYISKVTTIFNKRYFCKFIKFVQTFKSAFASRLYKLKIMITNINNSI